MARQRSGYKCAPSCRPSRGPAARQVHARLFAQLLIVGRKSRHRAVRVDARTMGCGAADPGRGQPATPTTNTHKKQDTDPVAAQRMRTPGIVLLRHETPLVPSQPRSRWQLRRRRRRARPRPRARDLGIAPGVLAPGPLNAITDVDGVRVGHTTLVEGDTRAHRRHRDRAARRQPVSGQGGRRGVRRQRVRQARRLDAGRRARHDRNADRADQHAQRRHGDGRGRPLHARAAGQRAGAFGQRARRRDQRRRAERHPRPARHARSRARRRSAARRPAPVAEGAVGAGTGTICFGWKGGIGTSSRRTRAAGGLHRRRARADQLRRQPDDRRRADLQAAAAAEPRPPPRRPVRPTAGSPRTAPACSSSPPTRRSTRAICGRLAARAVFGLARTGSSYSNGSGDFAIAFSTSPELRSRFNDDAPRARARCCRPTPCRRCSRPRSRRRKRRSTTRSSRRPPCARRTAPPKRFRSTACASCLKSRRLLVGMQLRTALLVSVRRRVSPYGSRRDSTLVRWAATIDGLDHHGARPAHPDRRCPRRGHRDLRRGGPDAADPSRPAGGLA